MTTSHTGPSRSIPEPVPVVIVDGRRAGIISTLRDAWGARTLGLLLVWRDIKVRYRQAAFGAAWALIRPLMVMLILSLVFGRLARFDTGDVPYASFVLAGIVLWGLFAAAVADMSMSVVEAQSLVTKVYFPRLVLPLSSLGVPLLDFVVASLLLVTTLLFQGVLPNWRWLLVPLPVLLALATATALGLWLAGLNAKYRDVPHVVPFALQALFFATPIVYPAELVPADLRLAYFLNPMAVAVDALRWCLFGGVLHAEMAAILVVVVMVPLATAGASRYFDRVAADFADVV